MANFQVPLNGSNVISSERRQAFQHALADNHQINCGNNQKLTSTENKDHVSEKAVKLSANQSFKQTSSGIEAASSQISLSTLDHALEHTYAHQSRTMEIHQQYLAQQGDYIQLITTVLDQQGKTLENKNGSGTPDKLENFQKTLDSFHSIREQGLKVHQEFLTQQAKFSERYLNALENGHLQNGNELIASPKTSQPAQTTEWVVKRPPIVLDEQAPEPGKPTPPSSNEPTTQIDSIPVNAGTHTISTEVLSEALLRIVGEKTGYPPEMLELGMDLEADLGIDSIKRVEILSSLEDEFPSLPPADTEVLAQTRTLKEIVDYMNREASQDAPEINPAAETPLINEPDSNPAVQPEISSNSNSNPAHSVADLTEILLEIVAEKTGYPAEMLEAEMDMEADLGIDSIKRVEILGTMEERVPGLPAVQAELLAELRTLGQIVELMSKNQSAASETGPEQSDSKKKVERPVLNKTSVKLVSLPGPDQLEIPISKDRPLIVTDEGSEFTTEVTRSLNNQGWKVILWRFPSTLLTTEDQDISPEISIVQQTELGKNAIESTLNTFKEEHGSAIGLIHLHPRPSGENLFSDRENQIVKQIFLLAGSLKTDLTNSESSSRSFFLSVTRIDGQLGMNNNQSFQEGSGLTGLVKTLSWEWPDVFCRSVDFSPALSVEDQSKFLLQEMLDPNLNLKEVGISSDLRVTIDRDGS